MTTKTVDVIATIEVPKQWTSFDIKAELVALVNDVVEDTQLAICEVSAVAPIADYTKITQPADA